ncbi:hypothetical protein MUP77_16175 [Candidatus Bathyarchaeota archaeon]|nr:hypothetical protein [Candidatus Bathyarchaeota archaeon]
MERKNVKWIGLASGFMLVAVILLSLFNPWWQLKVGEFGYANFSPLNTVFSFLGITFLVPLLNAVSISCLLLLSISAALMIVYSVRPNKSYSKQLLYWSYKTPLSILITFAVSIVVLSLLVSFIAKQYANIDFTLPIMGTSVIPVPSELLGQLSRVQIGLAVSGAFQWTFFLAVAAAVLCLATRISYGKAIANATSQPIANTSSNPVANATT